MTYYVLLWLPAAFCAGGLVTTLIIKRWFEKRIADGSLIDLTK